MRIYEIMVDRFSSGDEKLDASLSFHTGKNWMGGNLNGITDKLEYIKDLGMDALWLTPIFASSAYHGYSIMDHFEIDSHFGSKEDLKNLVSGAHKLGMKVILDFVANHVSNLSPFFVKARKDKASKYFKWFVFKTWPDDYDCFLSSKGLPKLNLENEETKEYVIAAAQYWIKEFHVDGYRLDFAVGSPMSFWNDFAKCCRTIDPKFILLPEIWLSGMSRDYLHTLWFAKHDSALREKLSGLLSGEKASTISWQFESEDSGAEELAMKTFAKITDNFLDFPLSFDLRRLAEKKSAISEASFESPRKPGRFAFLDNHDMERIMWTCNNNSELFTNLIRILSSFENTVVYYGTEIGMTQLHNFRSHSDLEARRFMKWQLAEPEARLLSSFRNFFWH
jgi:glycosidase